MVIKLLYMYYNFWGIYKGFFIFIVFNNDYKCRYLVNFLILKEIYYFQSLYFFIFLIWIEFFGVNICRLLYFLQDNKYNFLWNYFYYKYINIII